MGGGGSGPYPIGDVARWVEKAEEELRSAESKVRRNVFLSFAYEDIDAVNLLRGQARNERLPLEFNDWSVSEPIDSDRAPYIKQKILERIDHCSVTVVFLSDRTPASKWVAWEIDASIERGKHVIGVYAGEVPPSTLPEPVVRHGITVVPWSGLAAAIAALD